jgi:UDP-2,4-diacetamido-2,4,6-trideoxy-beta-L-altropyranose hydrolase
MSALYLRPGAEDDSRRLWEWVNDPVTRQASFSSEPIPWDEHAAWFARRLQDPDSVMYLACDEEDNPVAFVRFDIDGSVAAIGINVAPDQRGKGYGTEAIRLAGERLAAERSIDRIDAYIRPENQASLRAFAKAGYEGREPCTVKGQPAVRMALAIP